MDLRKFPFCLIFLVLLFFSPIKSMADQPVSSYWFPEGLMEWTPENDPHSVFNKSTVPLKQSESLYQDNDHAHSKAKLSALSALNPHTSGVPSQGGKEFFANTFSYWQYVDLMVYWAGSAGEGIIVPPSADVIDAAHKNGVPILGNIFFPPTVYGGKFAWVEQMLVQNDDGSFPAADKLLEVAEYYGFDGWFINQETEGGTTKTAEKMNDFLDYLQANKREGMHIQWYDSMIDNGRISWQNALTDRNQTFFEKSDSMFLNFWWNSQKNSSEKAKQLGRSEYDLYTGIDVEARGTETNIPWEGIFPEGQKPYTSLGIYRPDWAFKTASSTEEFFEKENLFWVGKNGDPRKTADNGQWKGMAHYFTAKTVINELPFTTNFNTGSGKTFVLDGKTVSSNEWNNRSLQDILPTWRWIRESNGTPLEIDFDWDQPFYGGSSLKISGEISKSNATNFKLYKTNLPIEKDTEISITYKTKFDSPTMKVGVSFQDHPDKFTFFDVKKKSHDRWTSDQLKLKKYEGKTIATISILLENDKKIEDYVMNIGELKIYNKEADKESPATVKHLQSSKQEFQQGIYTNLALNWKDTQENVSRYDIYRILPDGSKEWVGATPNTTYYLSNLKRIGKEKTTKLEVVTVNEHNQRSKPISTSFEWPAYPIPTADFDVKQTVAAPGEEIQFFNKSSEVTEEWEWYFEGGSPETSTEENPIVMYSEEGKYTVRLTAKNSEGKDTVTKEALITISKDAKNITNLALNKIGTVSGRCAASEGAEKATDGIVTNNSKWCSLDKNAWLQLDLRESKHLTKFVLKHAEAGGEPAAFNTKAFSIKVSQDGVHWSDAVAVNDNTLGISEHSIVPVEARYVRLDIIQPTQGGDQATRIYEFEVYGF
ncbi:discoidin domain-containing protein [Bacillus sp. FJAT-49682]|uniref:Discoidin domain-containing protein n=1 Tax=Lederbergia citrea TaxID=2833581 RepID=A0A942UPL3_9BACI|nr:discoidin domain-containing protein [Lederbergia citrea]